MRYKFDFASLIDYWPAFLRGTLMTLNMTLIALVFGLTIGVLCAIGRRGSIGWIRRICAGYVEIVRNTPFLIQIFFIYFGLASIGLKLPVFFTAIFAMVFNVGAYSSEIVRAGMDAVPPGQIEAAETLGLTRVQIYWDIILRPALEKVYPALTSQFVLMMLATSVTSQISAEELTAIANTIQSDTFRSFETFIVVAVLYLLLSLLMRVGFWLLALVLFPRRRKLGTAL